MVAQIWTGHQALVPLHGPVTAWPQGSGDITLGEADSMGTGQFPKRDVAVSR